MQHRRVRHSVTVTNSPDPIVSRAYFQATSPDGNASSLVTMFGGSYNPGEGSGPNAIEPVIRTIDRDGTERYFDMNGRLLNGKPQKGLYIHNGKKYTNKLNTLH